MDIQLADALKIHHAFESIAAKHHSRRNTSGPAKQKVAGGFLKPTKHTSTFAYNPLLPTMGAKDGFRPARLVNEENEEDGTSVFFNNPSMEADSEMEETGADRRATLAPPSWAPQSTYADDDLQNSVVGVICGTVLSWEKHIKLIGIMLVVIFLYELCMWLYIGETSAVFFFLAWAVVGLLIFPLLTAMMFIASSEHVPYATCKRLCKVFGFTGLVCFFFRSVASPAVRPLIPLHWVSSAAVVGWGLMFLVCPAYLLYIFRGAFIWDKSRRFLAVAVIFLWLFISLGAHWEVAMPDYRMLPFESYFTTTLVFLGFFWLRTGEPGPSVQIDPAPYIPYLHVLLCVLALITSLYLH
jgi:hypothetical protein